MLVMTVAVVIVIFCLSFSAPARENEKEHFAEEQEILAREMAIWQSLMGSTMNTEFFERSLAPGFLVITASGVILSAQEQIAEMKGRHLAALTIGNPQIRPLSEDSALIVYQAKIDATHDGPEVTPRFLDISTTWVRRSNKWLVQLHTETPTLLQQTVPCETFGEMVSV